jgi:hypothetical protein
MWEQKLRFTPGAGLPKEVMPLFYLFGDGGGTFTASRLLMSEGSITRELTGDEISEENIMNMPFQTGTGFERGRYGKS